MTATKDGMGKAADSGDSLTIEMFNRFIEMDTRPKHELVAPNLEIAKQWAKQYPGHTILLSAKHIPTTPRRIKKGKYE